MTPRAPVVAIRRDSSRDRVCSPMPAPAQQKHHSTKRQHDDSPRHIDVHSQRSKVDRLTAEGSIHSHHRAKNREHQSDWQAYIDTHRVLAYRKTRFSNTPAPNTAAPAYAGRRYHAALPSLGFSVSEYTSPTSSLSSRGRVTTLMNIVATKHTDQAQTAVQKFCAVSLG